jgi:ribosome modulation factor
LRHTRIEETAASVEVCLDFTVTTWIDLWVPYLPAMTEPPDDNLDHYALGFYAVSKGLRREDCPYAEGIEAHSQWVAGYDEGVKEKET